MKNLKPNYGNWIPQKIILVFLLVSIISFCITITINYLLIQIIFLIIAIILLGFFTYLEYAYWLLEKDNRKLQKQFYQILIKNLYWDGKGKALDIGTGNGPVAIMIAKRFSNSKVIGIDYWSKPWNYSKTICDNNAKIEGVAKRVTFRRASAVNLPFKDGEFDAIVSNFVFHAIKENSRISLIKEALRVLKKGGTFAFQDLFNKEFYGDINLFLEEINNLGLKEVKLIKTSNHLYIPYVLRINHIVGNSGILYGKK